jgi:hypothetical protein
MKHTCFALLLIFGICLTVAAQEQYGTVYLYREIDTQDYGTQIVILNSEARVYLDEREFLSMPERTFIGFRIPVGQYWFRVGEKRPGNLLIVNANQIYYLRVTQMVYPYLTQFISGAEEKTGLEAIRKCYTLKEKKIRLKIFEVIRTNPNSKKKSRT